MRHFERYFLPQPLHCSIHKVFEIWQGLLSYPSTFDVAGSARNAATWAGSKWAIRLGVSWSSSGVGSPAKWSATQRPTAGATAKPYQEPKARVSPSSPEMLPMKGISSRFSSVCFSRYSYFILSLCPVSGIIILSTNSQ